MVGRMVVMDIEFLSTSSVLHYPPISCLHLAALKSLFEPQNNFRTLLSTVYNLPFDKYEHEIAEEFLMGDCGLRYLPTLFHMLLQQVSTNFDHVSMNMVITPILGIISLTLNIAFNGDHALSTRLAQNKSDCIRVVHQVFRELDRRLDENLNQQNDPLATDFRRESLPIIANLLRFVMTHDKQLAAELFKHLVGSTDLIDAADYPAVAVMAWKLKLMKKYIKNGRMDLRVLGADTMAQDLVNFFNEHKPDNSPIRTQNIPPAFQCIAAILVAEKVVDYIVSVSSHPQIVSRSNNIIGFLVVTNNFTKEKSDLIWNTLVTSKDPRMTVTLMVALCNVVKQLANDEETLYLCKKMLDQPIPVIGVPEASHLIAQTIDHGRNTANDSDSDSEARLTLMLLAISLMRQCAQYTMPNGPIIQIQDAAFVVLRGLAGSSSPGIRQQVYKECVAQFCDPSKEATSMQAISTILKLNDEDLEYVTQDLQVTQLAMDSFSRQVGEWKSSLNTFHEANIQDQLERRLELILHLFILKPDSVSPTVIDRFWDSLVGKDAVSAPARDFAWRCLENTVFRMPQSTKSNFLDLLYEKYIPRVEPTFYVSSFLNFAEKIALYKLKAFEADVSEFTQVLTLPGIQMIWQIILQTPEHVGLEKAIRCLTVFLLDKQHIEHISGRSLDENYTLLIAQCIETMRNAYLSTRKQQKDNEKIRDSMDIAVSDVQNAKHDPLELPNQGITTFVRTASFLTSLLNFIRNQPDLCSPPNVRPTITPTKEDVHEVESPKNAHLATSEVLPQTDLKIAYEVHKEKGDLMNQWLIVRDLLTCKELHQFVTRVSGLQNFRLIWGGRRVSLMETPMLSLRDFGASLKGRMLILEDRSTNSSTSYVPDSLPQANSHFERELMKHFETLYSFMDSDDQISRCTLQFLKNFQSHPSICALIIDESSEFASVFPVDQPCKQLYSLGCLSALLSEKVQSKSLEMGFVHRGIHLLEWVISNPPSNDIHQHHSLRVAEAAIPVISQFLKRLTFTDEAVLQDPKNFIARLVNILELAQHHVDAVVFVGEIYELLFDIATQCLGAWEVISTSVAFRDLHLDLLLCHANTNVITTIILTIQNKIYRLSPETHVSREDLTQFYWSVCSELFEKTVEHPSHSSALYALSLELFQFRYQSDDLTDAELEQIASYFNLWSSMLLQYEPREFIGRETAHPIIAGLCNLLKRCEFVLHRMPGIEPDQVLQLAAKVWEKFLFPPCSGEPGYNEAEPTFPIFDANSRERLYELVYTITATFNHDAFRTVADWVTNIGGGSDINHRFVVDRLRLIRCPSGYLGLKNLSNTCYINSLLTQLYMHPGFRAFMVSQQSNYDPDGLLNATRELFCSLQNSFEQYGDPSQLVRKIRTYTGESINVYEQMDVEEFFNLLFEQWENQMPTHEAKQTFRSFYGGKIVYQIKSLECEHVSEREEPCLNIQCDVQGIANLNESLLAYIQGDAMQGDNKYKCEKCGGKLVDAVRRTCLKEVPDNLILHLKRFEYDLSLQRRNKINDSFAFPMELNMAPYTFSHLSEPEKPIEEDKFELVGVLVHKGHAEHGHYISYIRARPEMDGNKPLWLLFDDSDVTEIDVNDIPDLCFGGFGGEKNSYSGFTSTAKSYSAYMLFYQRSSSMKGSVGDLQLGSPVVSQATIPTDLNDKIQEDNSWRLRLYSLFGIPHFRFVRQLVTRLHELDHEDPKHKVQEAVISAVWHTIWRVHSRIRDSASYDELSFQVRSAMAKCQTCTILTLRWFIHNPEKLRDLISRTTLPKVRHRLQETIIDALQSLRETSGFYGVDVNTLDLTVVPNNSSSVIWPLFKSLEWIARNELGYGIRAWDEFFNFLIDIAFIGRAEALCLIASDFLCICLEYLNLIWVVNRDSHHPYYKVCQLLEKKAPGLNNIGILLSQLLRHTDLRSIYEEQSGKHRYESLDKNSMKLPLSQKESQLLRHRDKEGLVAINKLFEKWELSQETEAHGFVLKDIIAELTRAELDLNIGVVLRQTMSEGIECYTPPTAETFIRAAPEFCKECPTGAEASAIIKSVSKTITGNEIFDGKIIFGFYEEMRQCIHPSVEPLEPGLGSFHHHVLFATRSFAPILLTSSDNYVRFQTIHMLQDMLFMHPPMADLSADGPTEMEKLRTRHVRPLFKVCRKKAADLLELETTKQHLQSLMTVLQSCVQYLEMLVGLGSYADSLKSDEDQGFFDSYQTLEQGFQAAPAVAEEELVHSGNSTVPLHLGDTDTLEALSTDFSDDDDELPMSTT
ncbi:hypothetical protein BT63DRAFT_31658 [Microthyrium microscopicum]|uniref:USP domain-containing protein n=1 Tax=Microthyrium microscopicum TaxID=703497 RepID=A0A6A6USD7_9PEZI|nr:hypothetical protein BT63DRAFT_31658 [Microthyrium microscopicum]